MVVRPAASRCTLLISSFTLFTLSPTDAAVATTGSLPPVHAGAGAAGAGAADPDPDEVWGAGRANVTVTRRFLRRPSSLPLSATGSAEPWPAAWKLTPCRLTRALSCVSTACARATDRGLLMASLPLL